MEPFNNSHPIAPIPIHGTEYNVSAYFSTADAFYVSDICNAEVPTYDVAVATLLYRHITEPQLSVNEIVEDKGMPSMVEMVASSGSFDAA